MRRYALSLQFKKFLRNLENLGERRIVLQGVFFFSLHFLLTTLYVSIT